MSMLAIPLIVSMLPRRVRSSRWWTLQACSTRGRPSSPAPLKCTSWSIMNCWMRAYAASAILRFSAVASVMKACELLRCCTVEAEGTVVGAVALAPPRKRWHSDGCCWPPLPGGREGATLAPPPMDAMNELAWLPVVGGARCVVGGERCGGAAAAAVVPPPPRKRWHSDCLAEPEPDPLRAGAAPAAPLPPRDWMKALASAIAYERVPRVEHRR